MMQKPAAQEPKIYMFLLFDKEDIKHTFLLTENIGKDT